MILEAAEANMGAGGPVGLRLQEVAKAAGVSHPTILHHFGSREGLIQALNLKAIDHLKSVLLGVMSAVSPQTMQQPAMSALAIVSGGVFAGVFIGKFARYVGVYVARVPV